LSAFNTALATDLTTARVYNLTSVTGTVSPGDTVTGTTYQATVVWVNQAQSQVLLQSLTGNFVQNETLTAPSGSLVVSDGGVSPSIILHCYNDWGSSGLNDYLNLTAPWVTSASNQIIITTPKSERHTGKPGTGFKVASSAGTVFNLQVNYVTVQGVEVQTTGNIAAVEIGTSASQCVVDAVIAVGSGIGKGFSVRIAGGSYNTVKNCLSVGYQYGFYAQGSSGNAIFLHNTSVGNSYGYFTSCSATAYPYLVSCIGYNNAISDFTVASASFPNFVPYNNASTDGYVNGVNTGVTVSASDFKNPSQNDYHLVSSSSLIGAGLVESAYTLNSIPASVPKFDIDGNVRGSVVDIGYDEYTLTAVYSSLSVQESTGDVLTATTGVVTTASLSVQESTGDVLTATSGSIVSASLSVQESTGDTLTATSGSIVSASLSVQESTGDVLTATAGVVTTASLSVQESTGDTLTATTGVVTTASLSVQESTGDVLTATTGSIVSASLSVQESTGDVLTATTGSIVSASLSVQESTGDTLTATTGVVTTASLSVQESTGDTLTATTGSIVSASLSVQESTGDVLTATTGSIVSASLSVQESTGDVLTATTGSIVSASLSVQESTGDVLTATIGVYGEFVTTLRATGGDFSTLSSALTSLATSLSTASVYNLSNVTGTVSPGDVATGTTYQATVVWVNQAQTQVLLQGLTGRFLPNETLTTPSGSLTVADGGASPSVVIECYNDWGVTGLTDSATTVAKGWGSFTPNNRLIIRTPASERHNGTFQTGFRLTHPTARILEINTPYTDIQGIEFNCQANASALQFLSGSSYSTVDSCIVQGYKSVGISNNAFALFQTSDITITNCLSYNAHAGFYDNEPYAIGSNFYNCTAISNDFNFYVSKVSGGSTCNIYNCVALDSPSYSSIYTQGAITVNQGGNALDNPPSGAPVSSADFVSYTTQNFHLASTSGLIGAGVNVPGLPSLDVDEQTRVGQDIGFDAYYDPNLPNVYGEFVTTLRATGGDFSTLSSALTNLATSLSTASVYSLSNVTGTVSPGDVALGVSHKSFVVWVNQAQTQVLLQGLTGRFLPNETLTTSSGSLTVADGGASPSVVIECYNDWGVTGLTDAATTIAKGWGSLTPNNRLIIRTPASERHNGTFQTGFRLTHPTARILEINTPYTDIQGIEFFAQANNAALQFLEGANHSTADSCIVEGNGSRGVSNIAFAFNRNSNLSITNCLAYNTHAAFYDNNPYPIGVSLYNCTAVNNDYNYLFSVVSNTFTVNLFDCIALQSNNASVTTVTSGNAGITVNQGGNSLDNPPNSLPASSADFVNYAGKDFHLAPTSGLIDAGVYTPGVPAFDVDGQTRAGQDIGFDYYPNPNLVRSFLRAVEPTSDSTAISVFVPKIASLSVQESTGDTLTATAGVIATASLSVQESTGDTLTATAGVITPASLSVQESTGDNLTATAGVIATASLSVQESTGDTLTATAGVITPASLSVQESTGDNLTATAGVIATASLSVQETSQDSFTGLGSIPVKADFVVTESATDLLSATANQVSTIYFTVSESGSDTFASSVQVIEKAILSTQESNTDSFSGLAQVFSIPVVSQLSTQETGNDLFSANVLVLPNLQVSKTVNLQWDVQENVGKDNNLQWDMISLAGQDLSIGWDLQLIAFKQLSLSWDVAQTVSSNMSLYWDMWGGVYSDLAMGWDITGVAYKDVSLNWNVIVPPGSNTGSTLVVKKRKFTLVPTLRDYNY